MTLFRKSTMEMFSSQGQWEHPCEVRISNGSVAVSYQGEDRLIVYEGQEQGDGHFKLTANGIAGRASLHRFADDDVLEGWWLEEGNEGMWRITLDE